MTDNGNIELRCLNLKESILARLLFESLRNDSKRILAGVRKPSILTRQLQDDLSEVYEDRAKLMGKFVEADLKNSEDSQ